MRLSGSVSHRSRRTFVGNGRGLSRGDRNRNARFARLRALVPADKAIVATILRHLHAVIITRNRWDPHTATRGTRRTSTPITVIA